MKTSFQVEIKEPCYQNWEHMIPNKDGRFCNSCQLTVIDFTNKTPDEISDYFKVLSNENHCGRFKSYTVKSENRIDNLIFKLNTKGFKYISLLIIALLVFSGCRTRRRTMGAYTHNKLNHKTEHAIRSSKQA